MELTAAQWPFLYFPLRHRFEQNFHVAAAIHEEIGREVDYRPVETDGAARAASLIADLL